MKAGATVLTALVAVSVNGLLPGNPLMAMQAEDVVTRNADTVLQIGIYEPIIRQLISGSVTVTYKEKLDTNPAREKAIPGIHAAMVDAAAAEGDVLLASQLESSRRAGRAALISAASAPQLARLAYLYGPLVGANASLKITFRPSDTASSALSRALDSMKEDPGYQARLAEVASEPGMTAVINKAAAITETYQRSLMSAANVAINGAMAAGRARANTYAAERGFEPVQSETNK